MINTLFEFLELPLGDSKKCFEKFSDKRTSFVLDCPGENFLYIEGHLKEKVLLCCHADTFFDTKYKMKNSDEYYKDEKISLSFDYFSNRISNYYRHESNYGIGADDRAGLAMLYLLKNSGHSILITDGEEHGFRDNKSGSRKLKNEYTNLYNRINFIHQFAVFLDKSGSNEFKTYDVGTKKFEKFIYKSTNFNLVHSAGRSDASVICDKICGVNFSIGYYNEHTNKEYINVQEWLHSFGVILKLISDKNLPKFTKNSLKKETIQEVKHIK